MKQDYLFAGTDAYGDAIPKSPSVPGSPTSEAAAGAIAPHVNALQMRVLDYIRSRGMDGSTDEEGIDALDMPASTFRPRRVELVKAHLIVDSGRTRKTKSQRNAVVWIATLAG